MSREQNFFICKKCGNMVGLIINGNIPLSCCGAEMEQLEANTVEASSEKHLPVVEVSGNTVKVSVGSVAHPMLEAHYIQWVYLQTKHGGQRKSLKPGDEPVVTFALTDDDSAVAAYEYCNLHGLWKTAL